MPGPSAPVRFFLPGPPVPAPRPRFRIVRTKEGKEFVNAYYAGKYKAYLKDAPAHIEERIPPHVPLEGNLEFRVRFYIERPKTTKRTSPRYDIDNYLKSIMDACTKAGVWNDDDQVVTVYANKVWAGARGEGTDVEVRHAPDG